MRARGIHPASLSKVNSVTDLSNMANRAAEIKDWVNLQTGNEPFVVIDDDLSINSLPASIKAKCVLTKPMIGLDDEATVKVLAVLHNT